MIQELKIKNFLSFRDEVTLSFEATKDKTFDNYQVVEVAPGVRLLRFAMILGANASGKSNLLQAIDFLRDFWFDRKEDIDESTGAEPFRLDQNTPNEPSEFSLRFWVADTRYWYTLRLDTQRIYEEKLLYYRNGSNQPTQIFRRSLDEAGHSVIVFNPAVLKVSNTAVEEIQLKCLNNTSFFAARSQVNVTLPVVDEARDWMRTGINPIIDPSTRMFEYAKNRMHKNAPLREYLLDFIHRADFNITDVRSDEVRQDVPEELMKMILDSPIPKEEKERVRKERTISHLNVEFVHTVHNDHGEEQYVMPSSLQSFGTKRTLGIEAAIYEALSDNSVLNIDEFDSSLHPDLMEFTIQRFLQTHSRSQLLISTHYDPLLTTIDDLIRKDSVWFTEKGEDGNTSLYSLVEFKGINKITSFQKSYRNGVFGALPNIIG